MNRDLVLLWLAITVSALGDFFSHIAVLDMLESHGGAATVIGGWVAARTVAIIVAGPLLGVFVDRWNRKTIMVISNVIRAGVVLLIPAARTPYKLYSISFLLSALAVASSAASNSILPSLARSTSLIRVNSVLTLSANVLQLVGPVMAGFVVSKTGHVTAFGVHASTSLVSAAVLSALTVAPGVTPESGAKGRGFWNSFKDGTLFVVRFSRARTLAITRVLTALGAGIIQVVLVVFVKGALRLGAQGFGIAMSAIGVGSMLGSIALTLAGHWLDPTKLLSFGTLGVGLSYTALAVSPCFAVTVFILFVDGLADSCVVTSFAFLSQRLIPDDMRGRFFSSTGTLFRLSMLVSSILGGLLADSLGVRASVLIAGVTIVVAGIYALISFNVQRFRQEEVRDPVNSRL